MAQPQQPAKRFNPFSRIGAEASRARRYDEMKAVDSGFRPYASGYYGGEPEPYTEEEREAMKARRAERKFRPEGFGPAGPRKQRLTWNTAQFEPMAPILDRTVSKPERLARAEAELEKLKKIKEGFDDRIYMIAKLVGGQDLTLKQNKSVRTLTSAQAWINQNDERRRLYYVQMEDFDGDGVPDDVVVRSKLNDRPVWINTWSTTGGTRFTKKNLVRDTYYDKYPSYYERLDAPPEDKFMPFYHKETDEYANAYTKFQRAISDILKTQYGLTLDKENGERLGDLAKRRAKIVSPLYRNWVQSLLTTNKIQASGPSSLKRALETLAENWEAQGMTADARDFAQLGGAGASSGGSLIEGTGASGMDREGF
jgi:hypothetical protein